MRRAINSAYAALGPNTSMYTFAAMQSVCKEAGVPELADLAMNVWHTPVSILVSMPVEILSSI